MVRTYGVCTIPSSTSFVSRVLASPSLVTVVRSPARGVGITASCQLHATTGSCYSIRSLLVSVLRPAAIRMKKTTARTCINV